MLFRVLSVLFIVLDQIRVIWAFSECFRNFTGHLFEVAPRRYFVGAAILRVSVTLRALIFEIPYLLRYLSKSRIWYAVGKLFRRSLIWYAICYTKLPKNLRVILSQSEVFVFLNSNCSEFSCFCSICSHCSQLTYISLKESIKTKMIVFWH